MEMMTTQNARKGYYNDSVMYLLVLLSSGTITSSGALPTAEGCSKVTLSEHSVLVSCCQSNNCVNYNKVYLTLVFNQC